MPNHIINWRPRDGRARGVLFLDAGDVHVWLEEQHSHYYYVDELQRYNESWQAFYIATNDLSRSGTPARLEMYELTDSEAERVLEALPNVQPPTCWQRVQDPTKRTKPEDHYRRSHF